MKKPLVLVSLALILLAIPAKAVFTLSQVTHSSGTTSNLSPSLSADGSILIFGSNADLVPGGNQDGNFEIFLRRNGGAIEQVTNTLNGGAGGLVTASGSHIVLATAADLTGENPDQVRQLFRHDLSRGTFEQITHVPAGPRIFSFRPNSDGSLIAFASEADLVPGGNTDGNVELFLWSEAGFEQLTDTAVGVLSFGPIGLSGDGNRIVFSSRDDFTGENADGNVEIFLYQVNSRTVTQVTHTDDGGGSIGAFISTDGNWVTFESAKDVVPGQNPEGGCQVFLYEVATGELTQITSGAGFGSINPTLSGTGNLIAFASNRDLVPGSNTDLNPELFVYDRLAGTFEQVTSTLGGDLFPFASIDRFGRTIAFYTDRNLIGVENVDLNIEMFLGERFSTCTPGATTLCLNQDRFKVEVAWERTSGDTGVGTAVKLTDDTGYFYFFNPANVEMVIKVLRGCPNNGRYWVFAGGLTNVEVDISVTDTSTGAVATYTNPLREPFQPIQDTDAFATCP